MELEINDVEESNAKCFACSSGLSYLEILFYGNRCLFCADRKINLSLIAFLKCAYYDWKIYQACLKLSDRFEFLGALGVLGYQDINQIKTIKGRKELLKILTSRKEV